LDVRRAVAVAVADTPRVLQGGERAEEIEEIRYEGITVLYEAEVDQDGDKEYESHMYPSGKLAERHRSSGGWDCRYGHAQQEQHEL
jgi:hypothetical protein